MVVALAICRLIVTVGLTVVPTEVLLRVGMEGELSLDTWDVQRASSDFGMLHRAHPVAVVHPGSAHDVARVVRAAYESLEGFTVSARGHGHSINGQALSRKGKGVVIEMSSEKTRRVIMSAANNNYTLRVWEKKGYVDVWGGELWIHVLRETLRYGLAPKSWTDYLYLSVGGTLSNAGISGQTFYHGPQISNVHQLDVVTGILFLSN